MAGKEPAQGPTAITVAANVKRLRDSKGLSYKQLSDRLAGGNWIISPVGVRRIEDGERRVSVDDLTALAAALDVSPITLLFPVGTDALRLVASTGLAEEVTRLDLWKWLCAQLPGTFIGEQKWDGYFDSYAQALPEWSRERIKKRMQEESDRDSAEAERRADEDGSDARVD